VTIIIQPLTPRAGDWEEWFVPEYIAAAAHASRRFFHRQYMIQVISAVEVAIDAPGMQPNGPEYHLSMSRIVRNDIARVSSADARTVLIQFGADGATEDNHVRSGKVRNFWMPVAEPRIGEVCACQDTEPAIREDKGDFVWRPAP
jgi:hypothetical protein